MIAALLPCLWAAAAIATTPGGWQVQALPDTSLALRPVAVLGDPVAEVAQLTLDARVGFGTWAVDAQLPWVGSHDAQDRWTHSYPGLLRVGGHHWFHREIFQIGLEVAVPVTTDPGAGHSWASLSNDVQPAWELLPVFQVCYAWSRITVDGRIGVGVRAGPHEPDWFEIFDMPARVQFDYAGVVSWWFDERFAAVAEAQLTLDAVPMTARLMGRAELAPGRGLLLFDLGLQIPILTYTEYWTLQPIAQVRWYPARPRA
jgi:hypothetical protein